MIFDPETTGLPIWKEPSDHPDQPHVVDIACSLFDTFGVELDRFDTVINPGVEIPEEVARLHGITTETARAEVIEPAVAFEAFDSLVRRAEVIVGHNVSFDIRMMRILGARVTGQKWECPLPEFCTMRKTTSICKIPKASARTWNDWKWPSLIEATRHFFDEDHSNAHRARPDCDAAARIFFHLRETKEAA